MANAVNRLSGRYAICQIANTNAILNLTSWQVRIRTEFVDGTAFGDFWDVPVPIKYSWTARAQGFYDKGHMLSYLEAYINVRSGATDILPATFVGYTDDQSLVRVFQGDGYTEMTSFAAPQGMAEQEIEIRGFMNPSFVG